MFDYLVLTFLSVHGQHNSAIDLLPRDSYFSKVVQSHLPLATTTGTRDYWRERRTTCGCDIDILESIPGCDFYKSHCIRWVGGWAMLLVLYSLSSTSPCNINNFIDISVCVSINHDPEEQNRAEEDAGHHISQAGYRYL